jgi:hypothetical protein
MNWYERHLNWSLFLAIILIPTVVHIIMGIISLLFGGVFIAAAVVSGIFPSNLAQAILPLTLVKIAIDLGILVWAIIAVLWYLGQKARSMGFIVLLITPSFFFFILGFLGMGVVGEIIGAIVALGCIISLFLLQNHSIGYGVDFRYGPTLDARPDTGQHTTYDERQLKELDYTPSQNVLDIAASMPQKKIEAERQLSNAGGDINDSSPPPKDEPEQLGKES